MGTLIFKRTTALLITALLLVPASIFSQEAVKNYSEKFALTNRGSLEIENRYGNIDVRNWNNNEISIEVNVRVTHPEQDLAERQLGYININFSREGDNVKAITTIDQRVRQQWLRWFSSGREDTGISINYTVYAPAEADLRITHRYGNVFINEARGYTFIDLMYGNLQANSIIRDNTRPLSEINLAYSTKATVNDADWLKINMRYSDLQVARCRALVVASSYSKLRVDQASSIVTESRYGEFNLGDISNFVAESAYTNYSINSVTGTLDVQSRYGNVRVDNMPAGFSSIKWNSSYGNLHVGMESGASYRLRAEGSYGSVHVPQGRLNRETRGTSFTLSGVVGEAADPAATVEITTRYGNVDLR